MRPKKLQWVIRRMIVSKLAAVNPGAARMATDEPLPLPCGPAGFRSDRPLSAGIVPIA
jgi:hypothetical protein